MLKLKNVSKFYYSGGVVTSGFSKVNLELEKGEFVAITGESGSGKSTLLNVISGLDTYEEGEMYINGEETSAYTSAEFETYRRKYIANIYQAFNLINSYTVFQNVEMVLLLNGVKRREAKKKVIEILKKVDLYSFRNTKASKLSGGQKQRVAIARALVKDTPIIVADEPTGNLDSKSAENVIELLSTLAADRLVIVVTHNYDQVEPYVTRKITMHDGRITEDLVLKEKNEVGEESEEVSKTEDKEEKKSRLNGIQRVRLGLRNTFNVVPKFLLLLFIFLFLCGSITVFYAEMRQSSYNEETDGYNWYFNNTDDTRIVIKKSDGSQITAEDFDSILAIPGVDTVYEDDIMLESYVYLEDSEYWYYIYGSVFNVDSLQQELYAGHMPQSSNEVVIAVNRDNYLCSDETIEELLNCDFNLNTNNGASISSNVKIAGVAVYDSDEDWNEYIYVTDEVQKAVRSTVNSTYSTVITTVAGNKLESSEWSMQDKVVGSDKVAKGEALVSEDWNWYFKNGKAVKQTFTVNVKNLYYEEEKTFTITNTYNSKTFTTKTGYSDYDYNNGVILINSEDYNEFFDKDSYQSSVFIEDYEYHESVTEALQEMGYTTLYVKDTLRSWSGTWDIVSEIFSNLWSSLLVIVLFFVSYFIIRLIMKSRNVYFATVRMLGGSSGDCRSLIVTELITVMNLAFVIICGFLFLYANRETIAVMPKVFEYISENTQTVNTVLKYLEIKDYLVLYLVLIAMSVLLALRYARQLFKSSAMTVYKEV